jgi:threonine/homoserine/homoserine lactone efflux protein
MLEYILWGFGVAFAAAIQPGPLQAFFLSSVTQHGWKRTLPAALAPVISDGPIAVLALVVLQGASGWMIRTLEAAGGLFLLYLAWSGFSEWRRNGIRSPASNDRTPRTLLRAVTVNLLNPNPYLGWSLVLGPMFLSALHQSPAHAAALIAAFYGTLIAVMAGTIVLFGTSTLLGPTGRRFLLLSSAVILAVLGVSRVVASFT